MALPVRATFPLAVNESFKTRRLKIGVDVLKVLKRLLSILSGRLFGDRRPGPPPQDPFARYPVPRKRGPEDRGASVALAEPNDE